jgi:hypothetical protein
MKDRFYIQIEIICPQGIIHAQLFSSNRVTIPDNIHIPRELSNMPLEVRVILYNPGGFMENYEERLVPAQESAIVMTLNKLVRNIQKSLNEESPSQ